MRRWLARFSFSSLVLAFLLFWTAYQRQKIEGTTTRVVLETVGGALLAAMGLAGVRERHRGSLDGAYREDASNAVVPNEKGPAEDGRSL